MRPVIEWLDEHHVEYYARHQGLRVTTLYIRAGLFLGEQRGSRVTTASGSSSRRWLGPPPCASQRGASRVSRAAKSTREKPRCR